VAFAYAFARAYAVGDAGLVMVIEEPEAHLHPLAQEWLGRKISELHGDGVQMIVTTHSPAFVDLNLGNPGALACVRKDGIDGATTVTQHSRQALAESLQQRGANGATRANIGPFYAASATSEHVAGMFARACVVVEGPTEALALPQLLDAAGLDLLALGIAVIPAGGVGAIARWLRLYEAYGIPCFAVFDSDSKDDPDGSRRRDLLLALGADEAAYAESVRDLEGLLVADGYAVFCPDFELALRSMLSGYDDLEEAAKAEVGATKPLVAERRAGDWVLRDGTR
jgi:putative ATP-dependent endonuclease of OLD family